MAKKPTKAQERAERFGCPPGFEKTPLGRCLAPELQKLEKQMDELEAVSNDLEATWDGMRNMALTSGDKIPFRGKRGGFKTASSTNSQMGHPFSQKNQAVSLLTNIPSRGVSSILLPPFLLKNIYI